MNSRILTLVKSWLVIDFFGDSRKSGEPGSSLTSTVFTQSFVGFVFAAFVSLPEEQGQSVAYLAANLTLSTLLIGIGLLGDPQRQQRELADELLVQTAPMPDSSLTIARVLHSCFHLGLVTTGMAIPPAVLSYWACGHEFATVPLYLVMATAAAGVMAGTLAVFTRFVHLVMGPARAQLLAGTLKFLLLGGGLIGFALCLGHLDETADALPLGRAGAMAWPPYWAARIIDQPSTAGLFWALLCGTGAALFVAGTALNRMRRNRVQRRPARTGLLGRLDRVLTRDGPLLGITRFVATMLYRSPGFRARVVPLFGIPAAMVLLSAWDIEDPDARALWLGITLQFPAIFLPFLIAFLPRSDHEHASWIFQTSPHQEIALYRAASLIALTTHVLLPVQAAALIALVAVGSWSATDVIFAVAMPVFSLGLGVLVADLSLRKLSTKPFTDDSGTTEETMEFGGLTTIAIVLALLGGSFSMIAARPAGLFVAAAVVSFAVGRIRTRCRGRAAAENPAGAPSE